MTVMFFRRTKASPRGLLTIYLNDHLAAAVGGIELAKRTRTSNTQEPFASFLDELCAELDQDRAALEEAIRLLQVPVTSWKQQAAYVAEKAGRAKLNGQLTGYSPLSRVVELEALSAAIAHKLGLWRSLQHLKTSEFRLADFDAQSLIDRAQRQTERLEPLRIAAVDLALAPTPDGGQAGGATPAA